jgi:hypothetical protein
MKAGGAAKAKSACRTDLPNQNLGWRAYQVKCETEDANRNSVWFPRDLAAIAGRPITASERIRYQQAVRKIEEDGLLCIDNRHLKLSPAGHELLEGAP